VALKKEDIEKLIEGFCHHKMGKEWKSTRTANSALFSLKTFFKANGFRGNNGLDVECFRQSVRERTRPEYIPTLDEARRMASVAGSPRNRAIILFTVSTGLRNGTLRALLYGDLKEELESGQPNILIKVQKGMKEIVSSACKGNIEYCTFTSSEASEALNLYLGYRRRFGELNDKEILFCSEHNRISRKERVNKPLTARELQVIVKTAALKAGIKEWKNVVPHALRKTFESVLRSRFADGGRLDLKTQEFFMGHTLARSMDTYFDKTKIDELRKEYAKLIFKPETQASIEVLDSLRGMAKVLGIDLARLEETGKEELGRDLNDAEKLDITQQAIKKVVTEFKKVIESNAKTTLLARSGEEFLGKQPFAEKNQTSISANGRTFDDFISTGNPLSKPSSAAIFPSTNQTCSSREKISRFASIQFDLSMRPQESLTKPRLQRRTCRVSLAAFKGCRKQEQEKRGGDLSQFL
jgi:integrase